MVSLWTSFWLYILHTHVCAIPTQRAYWLWYMTHSLLPHCSFNSQGIVLPPTLSTLYNHLLLELLASHHQMVTGLLYVAASQKEGEQRRAVLPQGVMQRQLGTIILVHQHWTLLWCFGQSECLPEGRRGHQKRTALVLVSIFAIDKLRLLSWVLHHGRRHSISSFSFSAWERTSVQAIDNWCFDWMP